MMKTTFPPNQFTPILAWWAQQELQWWDDNSEDTIYRPTEERAFFHLLLRQWALHDGAYWHLLSDEEWSLHQVELWLIATAPQLTTPRARAEWTHFTLYPHYSPHTILAIWATVDEVICAYAHEQLSLWGLFFELWQQTSQNRQAETEQTPLAEFTLQQHLPPVLGDDGVDDGQA